MASDIPYVDVFISHNREDTDKARDLMHTIKSWSFSCYIAADDDNLQKIRSQIQSVNNERLLEHHINEMAKRIREHLRACRCLIYVFSSKSVESRWMPWELGFSDGRWGSPQVGLFNLDKSTEGMAQAARDYQYLKIYGVYTKEYLQPFLKEHCSTRALFNRTDVDFDRVATLTAGMLRNPTAFSLAFAQYALAWQQAILKGSAQYMPSWQQAILQETATLLGIATDVLEPLILRSEKLEAPVQLRSWIGGWVHKMIDPWYRDRPRGYLSN